MEDTKDPGGPNTDTKLDTEDNIEDTKEPEVLVTHLQSYLEVTPAPQCSNITPKHVQARASKSLGRAG